MKRSGFTILEVLVVVIILILLTGIAIYVGFGSVQSGKRNATMTTLRALDGLRVDYQRETDGVVPADMTAFLDGVQGLPNLEKGLRGMPSRVLVSSGGKVTAVKDAWDNVVVYVATSGDGYFSIAGNPFVTADHQSKVPFFASSGTDGKLGTDDDLLSFMP